MLIFRYQPYKWESGTNNGAIHIPARPEVEYDSIYVASDWEVGRDRAKKGEAFHDTGYVGSGSAKEVIYVRLPSPLSLCS